MGPLAIITGTQRAPISGALAVDRGLTTTPRCYRHENGALLPPNCQTATMSGRAPAGIRTRISTVAAWKVIHYPTDAHWNLDARVANPRFTPDVQTVMSPSQLAVPFPCEEYHLSAPETRSVRALINARFRCRASSHGKWGWGMGDRGWDISVSRP